MTSGIYEIKNMLNNKRYIGSSKNIENRTITHIAQLEEQKHHSIKLQRSWNKYGQGSFIFNIIELCESSNLIEREQFYIDLYNSYNKGYNCLPLARSSLGYKFTLEQKEKLSSIRKGKKRKPCSKETKENISKANKGKKRNPHSKETKRKISAAHKLSGHSISEEARELARKQNLGKSVSQETKNKISISSKGRKLSSEHKAKISNAHKGKIQSIETKRKLSKIRSGNFKPSEETKKKMSDSQKNRRIKEREEEEHD